MDFLTLFYTTKKKRGGALRHLFSFLNFFIIQTENQGRKQK
jgi:hypothetical protein